MNSNWKKFLMTTIVLTTAVAPNAYAQASGGTAFADLQQAQANKQEAIQKAAELGLIAGDPNGQFRPTDAVTREELAVLIGRALKLSPGKDGTFADVSGNGYGRPFIEAMQAAGLMNGDENHNFRPYDSITREELATVLVRVLDGLNIHGGTKPEVSDNGQVSGWAQQYVDTSLRLNLVPTNGGAFNPQGTVQRQDIVDVLLDLFQPKEQTATINSVNGDIVTIDGVPYLATGNLKKLLSENNAAALSGAKIHFDSLTRGINKLGGMTIVKSGDADHPLTLDLGGATINGPLTISGDHVAITGSSQIGELIVTNAQGSITLGKDVKIDQLTLPDNADPSKVIVNYNDVMGQIGKVNDHEPPKPEPKPEPTPTPEPKPHPHPNPNPTPNPVNHAPTVVGTLANQEITIGDTIAPISLANLFTDADGDTLSLTTETEMPGVATVSIDSQTNELKITPLNAGTTKVSVWANDGHNAPVEAKFTLKINPLPPVNHAPTVVGTLADQAITLGDTVNPIPLAGVFSDEDQDVLTYQADTEDHSVATASIVNGELVITPVAAGTTTVTLTANDGVNTSDPLTFSVTIAQAVTKSAFISEANWGADFNQAFEIYNPTGAPISFDSIKLVWSGGEYTPGGGGSGSTVTEIPAGGAMVFADSMGDLYTNHDNFILASFGFDIETAAATQVDLYIDDVLVDTVWFTPGQTLKRIGSTVHGETTYDAAQWVVAQPDDVSDLGSFTPAP